MLIIDQKLHNSKIFACAGNDILHCVSKKCVFDSSPLRFHKKPKFKILSVKPVIFGIGNIHMVRKRIKNSNKVVK